MTKITTALVQERLNARRPGLTVYRSKNRFFAGVSNQLAFILGDTCNIYLGTSLSALTEAQLNEKMDGLAIPAKGEPWPEAQAKRQEVITFKNDLKKELVEALDNDDWSKIQTLSASGQILAKQHAELNTLLGS